MCNKRRIPFFILSTVIMLVLVACGAAPKETPTPVVTEAPPKASPTQAPPTVPPTPAPTEVPAGLVTKLSDLKKATIQIEAEGTFIDPEFGYLANAAGRGSGFIIDPSGIAITNNHVVTGAALLKVWVGGDTTKVYNARILGVSECSDLAVIDIEGDGFPYLSWYDGTANVGLQVYAAGYPLGDPEFTMTQGIVSKEKANGETTWASVDSVIEHTATINPGNSGGPLVDANAKVVGINYAGVSSTKQYYAINRGTALSVIEQLRTGKDVDSIGINGEAVSNEDGSLTGIWVSSVKSGSPADKTGIRAGDIVTSLENLYLATDGTFKDYCDVLRTHGPDATLAVQVLRWENQDLLEGQLNGRQLAVVASGIPPTAEQTSAPGGSTPGPGTNLPANCSTSDVAGWITCYDSDGQIQVDVPDSWIDVNAGTWTYDEEDIGVAIIAAPSIDGFNNYYDAEGVFFGASGKFAQYGGYVEFLDYYTTDYSGDCHLDGRFDYNDGLYRGKYDQYSNCGGTGGYDAYVLSAVDITDPTSKIIVIEVQTAPGDVDTVNQIMKTFYVFF
jgi:serine protease Do